MIEYVTAHYLTPAACVDMYGCGTLTPGETDAAQHPNCASSTSGLRRLAVEQSRITLDDGFGNRHTLSARNQKVRAKGTQFMTFNVLAGDFNSKRGTKWDPAGFSLWPKDKKFRWSPEQIPMSQIEMLERASEQNIRTVGGRVGWGLAGAMVLGPVGLMAGLLLGGKKTEITFFAKFTDGRKLVATVDSKTWARIVAARADEPSHTGLGADDRPSTPHVRGRLTPQF